MPALFHGFVLFLVGAALSLAGRSDKEDVDGTSEPSDAHLLSVTHSGHFVSQPVEKHEFSRPPPSELAGSASEHHGTAGRPVLGQQQGSGLQRKPSSLGQLDVERVEAHSSSTVGKMRRSNSRARRKARRASKRKSKDRSHAPEDTAPAPAPTTGGDDSGAPPAEKEQQTKPDETEAEKEKKEHEEEDEERAKKLKEAEVLTPFQKSALEVWWLVGLIIVVLVLFVLARFWPYRYIGAKDYSKFYDAKGEAPEFEHAAVCQTLYETLWGRNVASYFVDALIVLVSLINFVLFALQSECKYTRKHLDHPLLYFGHPLKDWVPETNYYFQIMTIGLFGALIILRVVGSIAHPFWQIYGSMAPVAFLVGDFFTHVEIVALIPSIIDLVTGEERLMNLTFITIMRSVEMISRHGSLGASLRQIESLSDEGPILRMVFFYGFILWILLSGLYWVANFDNEESEWDAVKYEAATKGGGKEEKFWQRFVSIPSSMFFTLINLSCEYPLADVHVTPLQRFFAMLTALIGVPLFAIPTGIIGASLQEKTTDELGDQGGKDTAQAEDVADDMTEEETCQHRVWAVSVFLMSFGSVIIYFFWTASIEAPCQFFGQHIKITDFQLAIVDGSVAILFAIHTCYQLYKRIVNPESYFRTLNFVIDVLSSAPGIVHFILYFTDAYKELPFPTDYLRACCVFRVLKPERYIGAFKVMAAILSDNKALLQTTGFVSCGLLILFSTLLYYTERDSPDEEVREYYGSAARAVWAELINLHGEWVWTDYSPLGKIICVIIDFVAIGICMVPIAIFSDGYSDRLSPSEEQNSLEMKPWQARFRPEEEGFLQQLYDAFYSHLFLHARKRSCTYCIVQFLSTSTIVVSTLVTVTLTLDRFNTTKEYIKDNGAPEEYAKVMLGVFHGLDYYCAVFFLVEYVLRCIATKGGHVISITGALDLVSLAALVVTCGSFRAQALHPAYKSWYIYDDILMPARLLRMFCLENYVHALHTIINVCYINWKPLLRSFYTLVCVWYIFGVCLYLCERPIAGEKPEKPDAAIEGSHAQDHEDGEDERTMEQRYADVLTGLQYALVHITGDYPITDYKLRSMPFHVVFCIAGLICNAAFAGIFTAGYTNYLEEESRLNRRVQAQKRLDTLTDVVIFIQAKFRRLRRRRLAALGGYGAPADLMASRRHPFQVIRDLLQCKDATGMAFVGLCNLALVVNIINTMFATVPEAEAYCPNVLSMIEFVTFIIFAVEYLCKLAAASPPFSTILRPMRVIDLLCLLPFVGFIINGVETGHTFNKKKETWERAIECAMIFRVVRVFDIPIIRKEAKKTWRAISSACSSLVAPFVLSLSVWVFTSSLFMWIEKFTNGPQAENMKTIPDAMYWTSIFIIGEWAEVDFSFGAGSRMCIFYCLVAVTVTAIPVGIIAESVSNSLQSIVEEQQELQRLLGLGKIDLAYPTKTQCGETAYNNNLGAPMIPAAAVPAVMPAPAPLAGDPRAEPIYMPRCPHQESAVFVPRPPGHLSPPPQPEQQPQLFQIGAPPGGPQPAGPPSSFAGSPAARPPLPSVGVPMGGLPPMGPPGSAPFFGGAQPPGPPTSTLLPMAPPGSAPPQLGLPGSAAPAALGTPMGGNGVSVPEFRSANPGIQVTAPPPSQMSPGSPRYGAPGVQLQPPYMGMRPPLQQQGFQPGMPAHGGGHHRPHGHLQIPGMAPSRPSMPPGGHAPAVFGQPPPYSGPGQRPQRPPSQPPPSASYQGPGRQW